MDTEDPGRMEVFTEALLASRKLRESVLGPSTSAEVSDVLYGLVEGRHVG